MKNAVGIDEVGRGPIAGPVAVGAFVIRDLKIKRLISKFSIPLRDSKKLTRAQRETWFTQIQKWQKEGLCDFYVKMISAKMIDKIGIAPSIKKALENSLYKLNPKNSDIILLDGGLKAPKEFKKQKTIIKGDEKEMVISLASICAKVTRDNYMYKQAKKYPQYGFENHVGYGTKMHYEMIKKYGINELHRRSFLRNIILRRPR